MKNLVRYNNIEYFMPFLFGNDLYIQILDKLLENEINPVKYVYGSPYCEWGIGGRPTNFILNNLNIIERYFQTLKTKYNIIPNLTFTNLNVSEKLNDEYSNNLLDIAYSLDCRFIVSTEELYNHIKSRYPQAKMHCSVIIPSIRITEEKDFNETKFYNEMLDKYEVVVVRPEYIMDNIDRLDKLLSDISRVEVLINAYCHYNCPHYRAHYNSMAELDRRKNLDDIGFDTEDNGETFSLCPKFKKGYRSIHLSDEQVSRIIDLGVQKLKIQGRSLRFSYLFDHLYKNFFNNEYSKEEIRNKIDKICAEILQNDRKAALFLNL